MFEDRGNRGVLLPFTWGTIRLAVETLAYRAAPLKPSLIVGISRGGLVPAVMLSHYLGCSFASIEASSYVGTTKMGTPKLSIDGIKTAIWAAKGSVIVVDDVIDTGETLAAVQDVLLDTPFFVIVTKDRMPPGVTYFATVPKDTWVEFPWEMKPA